MGTPSDPGRFDELISRFDEIRKQSEAIRERLKQIDRNPSIWPDRRHQERGFEQPPPEPPPRSEA